MQADDNVFRGDVLRTVLPGLTRLWYNIQIFPPVDTIVEVQYPLSPQQAVKSGEILLARDLDGQISVCSSVALRVVPRRGPA